ncbi:oxidoreductase [Streptomyces sp. NBC_01476]|uniref:oxidoreductase n=1 Tax=Streptomyces sp. NBC_01476 TaxID=2903881 RepID=UPI002E332DB9|nr:oxidoreductase [Streptomyces sp. NBC_01476]
MSAWTVADIPAQHGKLALVTGANSGLGRITALELARAGATVLLAGRTPASLEEAAAAITREVPGAGLLPVRLDLADLASVEEAAAAVIALDRPLDLLINNAGVMAVPERRTTKDGFELTFGTNHLGHFALTGRLLPALLRAESARVVTVSALVARNRGLTFDDVAGERKYTPMSAYALSKYANVVFTQELARRAAATPLTAVAVHPGSANTGIQRHVPRLVKAVVGVAMERVLGQRPEEAALPSLYAATEPGIAPAAFIGPTGRMETRGAPGPVKLPATAADPAIGRTLWELSERLTHVGYALP